MIINLCETEDESLARNSYRYKENCINFSWKTIAEFGDCYCGQGDYRLSARCLVDKLQYLDIYTPEYAQFACPLYCLLYTGGQK
jgi:hypothetical protein